MLEFAGFTDYSADRPMPFAAILDLLPTVVLVPGGIDPSDEVSKGLREDVWGYAKQAGLRAEMNTRALVQLGEWGRNPDPDRWYRTLRRHWQPAWVRTLLVVDVVPDPRGPRHHFYAEPITTGDDLFRGVVEAMYGQRPGRVGQPEDWLAQLQDDGIYAIDVVTQPIVLPADLEAAMHERASAGVDEIRELRPELVVLCGESTFEHLAGAGLPVRQSAPMPVPSRGRRERFVADLKRALRTDG